MESCSRSSDGGGAGAGEVAWVEAHLPGLALSGAGADGYLLAAGEGVEPHAGRVFPLGEVLLPVAAAEGQDEGGVGDALAVVGDGYAGVRSGDFHVCGAGAAGVLEQFVEDIAGGGVEEVGDSGDGVLVDGGLDVVR